MKITSLQNPRVKAWVKLKDKKHRDKSDVLLIEGDHLIEEAKKANLLIETLGTENADIEITEHISEKLSETKSGSARFAIIKKPKYENTIGKRILVLDGLQDPGNVGTCIRTAYSFGFDAVYLSNDAADIFNDKTIRASQGAILHIPCIRQDLSETLSYLKEKGMRIYATHVDDKSTVLKEVKQDDNIAIVMGSEGQGVSKTTLDHKDLTLHVETSKFESLNVAVACGIICYELRN